MRIAMVSEHASPLAVLGGVDAGGQNVHVADLSRALARAGHEVTVYTRRDDEALADKVKLCKGVTVEHVTAGPAAALPKDELLPYMDEFGDELARRWSKKAPDLVHTHFWMSGLAGLRAREHTGVPVVHTYHALGLTKRRHQGAADTSPVERVDLEAHLARSVDHIVATATEEAFELRRMGARRDQITIVPCGVDVERFTPHGPVAPRGSSPRILSLGRLVERKGVDMIITALRMVPDAELVIAGGPDQHELDHDADAQRLMAAAAAAGVAGRVHLVGRVSREEAPALIRSADVVVCVPWYEPFGIVPLEAMACARPVVAAAVGGLADTVVNGVTGVLVPPTRPQELAMVLRRLLADDMEREGMGQAGLDRVLARYSWERVAHETEAVYQGLGLAERRLTATVDLREAVPAGAAR
ncbi:MAG: glycosyltransferase [Actinomycetales bacterium]